MAEDMKTQISQKEKPIVFILDDDQDLTHIIEEALVIDGRVTVKTFTTIDAMIIDHDLIDVDLFIIDVQLNQELTGFEVPDILPDRCRFAAFLFISGYAIDAGLYEKSKTLSLFDFIAKPFSIGQLKQRVQSLLGDRLRLPNLLDDRLINMWTRDPFLAILCDDTMTIRLANDAMARVLGISTPRDLVGTNFNDYLPAYCRADVQSLFDRIMAGDKTATPGETEIEVVDENGKLHRIMFFCSAFEGDDGRRLVLSVGVPAGARKRKRLHVAYREILIKDRAAIRNIRPLKPAQSQTCQWEV